MAQRYLPTERVDITFNAWWTKYGRTPANIPRALARTRAQIGPPVPPDYVPPPHRFAGGRITATPKAPLPDLANDPYEVVVIPNRDHVNNCYPQTAYVFPDNLRFHDAEDLAYKLKNLSREKNAKIKRLVITGHGSNYQMWIGLNLVNLDYLKDPKNSTTVQLARIRDLLDKDAIVVLRGCEVGQNEELIRTFSKVLGDVRVQATTIKQNCTKKELEPPATECNGNTCTPIR